VGEEAEPSLPVCARKALSENGPDLAGPAFLPPRYEHAHWIQDRRYAGRSLRKKILSTLVIPAPLSIGIGANSAVFRMVDALLLPRCRIRSRRGWLRFGLHSPAIGIFRDWPSPGQFLEIQNENHAFDEMALAQTRMFTLIGHEQPELVAGIRTQSSLLKMFGARVRLGRVLLPVAILSDRVWRRLFNCDPEIVGKSITLDANSFTVAGVCLPEIARRRHVCNYLGLLVTMSESPLLILAPKEFLDCP
jgi:hypothetical protein